MSNTIPVPVQHLGELVVELEKSERLVHPGDVYTLRCVYERLVIDSPNLVDIWETANYLDKIAKTDALYKKTKESRDALWQGIGLLRDIGRFYKLPKPLI